GTAGGITHLDLQMLTLFNGKERTEEEFRDLGQAVGWKLETVVVGSLLRRHYSSPRLNLIKHLLLKSSMSAQDRLPPDLLSKIFITAFNATRYLYYPMKPDQIPWTVSRVSSRWRMVARSQHTLWNRIKLNMFFKGKPASAEEALQFLQTAVHPSGPLHFDIMLGFRRGVNVELFLIPYLGRLKGLRIDGSEYIVDVLSNIPPHSSGNLEILELDINIHAIESPDIA
ncbi:hypothetical protein H0H93_013815, partial [Arthromyces matolae]